MAILCLVACEKKDSDSKDYVDLGLTSGTKWKKTNETNSNHTSGLFTMEEMLNEYKKQAPRKEQLTELRKECTWTWNGDGYQVTGPNGNSIILPAEGYSDSRNEVYCAGMCGYYWSSTTYEDTGDWHLRFARYESGNDYFEITYDIAYDQRFSVRLVKK